MAQTRCPHCGKPAILIDSRGVETWVTELQVARRVVERFIDCHSPNGCGRRLRVYRVDLVQGETRKSRAGK